MQLTIDILILITLTLVAVSGWAINILGMPGNWLVVALAAGAYFWGPVDKSLHVTLTTLVVIIATAGLGELLEFAAGALGASRLGATKRASLLAVAGAMCGAVVGLLAGTIIPIPIVGSVIGSVLLASAGAAVGAVGGERWAGKEWSASLQVGHAAFWGRLFGTVGKVVCGTIVCAAFLIAIFT